MRGTPCVTTELPWYDLTNLLVRLVEYILQPLTHKIKTRIGEVISYMSLAISPTTPSLNVESCKLVSFRNKKQVYLHHVDSWGFRGLYFIFGLLTLLEHVLLNSCNINSFHRTRRHRVPHSALSTARRSGLRSTIIWTESDM